LAALLHIATNELFGIFFEYRVNLVEKVVDVFADLLNPLSYLGIDLGRYFINLVFTPRLS